MTIPRLSLGSFDRVLSRQAYSFSLQVGATLELQAFVQRLLKIGYNRVMKVMEHGGQTNPSDTAALHPSDRYLSTSLSH
jgi:transcription-repair coupling factor (superfamily II helicase)